MDERLSGMSNRFAGLPGDVALQGRLRQDLYRLVAGGARDYLPAYARAGGQWIEDLTNRRDILDAESLPTETDVPVFRFWGVQSRGNSLVVTVRDLLEGRSAPMMSQVEY